MAHMPMLRPNGPTGGGKVTVMAHPPHVGKPQ